jgi:lipoprotein-anchoring transpeptidase ErfK/SrfK
LLKALGAAAVEPVVSYTITGEDAAGPFAETIPQDMTEKSKLPGLYYTSVLEGLGEKFHSSPALLKRLNPRARFIAGERIRVPNVLDAKPAAPEAAKAAGPRGKRVSTTGKNGKPVSGGTGAVKVVVSKQTSALTVYDPKDKIVFYAPVTSGSEHDPLPIGNWVVTRVRRNPVFNYNPDLFWDAEPASTKAQIPAGPNSPVGVVWIEISKPHYGIHGAPEPGRIGYSESHGCVRLANWDATRLADLVKEGTPVVFEE